MGSKENGINKKIDHLADGFSDIRASLNVLFQENGDDGLRLVDIDRKDFIADLSWAVNAAITDLMILAEDNSTAERRRKAIDETGDSIDCLNALFKDGGKIPLVKKIESAVMDIMVASDLFASGMKGEFDKEKLAFELSHAQRLCDASALFREYLQLLEELDRQKSGLTRIYPGTDKMLSGKSDIIQSGKNGITAETLKMLEAKAIETDPFAGGSAFRFLDHEFYPADLNSIRKTSDFYGYSGVRKIFQDHFEAFAKGESNLPLLISSLPGLGKTHFSISYTLEQKGLILVLPEPEDIERNLEPLIRRLAKRKNHKFVLFFDDIDTRQVNWYYFRTNVGGSFMLPSNINIVIASNFEFPANISSRGRGITFPMFDEINCQGMIADFLTGMGMRKVHNDLVAVIAADYVAEFGQRKFEELSPRTLVRYLERYKRDAVKRKKMLELSQEELITTPDPQVFFDFNVKLMKMLYGDDAIERLQRQHIDEA